MATWMLLLLPVLPWLGALAIILIGERQRGLTRAISVGACLGSAVALGVARLVGPADGILAASIPWIPSLGVRLAVRLDALSMPFVVNLLIVSLGAVCYAWGYWRDVERAHLAYALLLAFIGSMLGTLLCDDMVLFLVFWEAMLVSSSLLLAGWGSGERVGPVTLQYFIFTQAGSLLLMVALVWLVSQSGNAQMSGLAERLVGLSIAQRRGLAVVLFLGFAVKLAVAPVHIWLPDAHAIAPMPVTILLAGAMLSMGAYGMLRFPVMLVGPEALRWLQLPLMLVALGSQVYGALLTLASTDIKRIVAYSSVSQMGYVLFGIATLTPQGQMGGVMHVVNHGILKALLFMVVGLIMSATGRRLIGQLGGLKTQLPGVTIALWVGAIALAGVPPFCAFHSEWLILSAGLASGYAWLGYLAFGVPLLTAGYAIWLASRATLGSPPSDLTLQPLPKAMRWTTWAFALAALLVGLWPKPLYQLASAAAELGRGGLW